MKYRLILIAIVFAVLVVSACSVTDPSSLQARLEAREAQSSLGVPADMQVVMKKAIEELDSSKVIERALNVGDKAPNFTLPNAQGGSLTLYDRLKQGPVVLSFYRGGWCPYCNIQLYALQEYLPEFKKQGGSLVALSLEKPKEALSTVEKSSLEFPVLSDLQGTVSREFGLLYELPADLVAVYKQFGIDLERSNSTGRWHLPLSATYVIAPSGEITYAFVEADYKKRAEPVEIVKALAAVKKAS